MTVATGTDELRAAIAAAVEGVAARFSRADYLEKARLGEPADELYRAMADQGLFAVGVAEELGGSGGGIAGTALVMEEMSRSGIPPMLFSLTAFSRQAILRFGTDAQIERYVVPSLNAEQTFSFALTEPDAGTNSFRMRSSAVRRTDGSYRLSGEKVFISGAREASSMLVVARTTPYNEASKTQGLSVFALPTGTDGISMEPMNIEWYAPERQFSVRFDDVVVPADALVGDEGEGAKVMFESLNAERVVVSAWALGLGYLAIEKAVAYARERAPWGPALGSYQAVAHPLARARAMLDAARGMTYAAAALVDAGEPAGEQANVAKLLASEAADAAVDAAIQTHGGSGFDIEMDVITLWPMVRLLRVAPINNEMVLNYIAEHMLGLPRSY